MFIGETKEIFQLFNNHKIYIIFISAYIKNKFIINNLIIKKLIKTYSLRYDYNLINNNIKGINIQLKEKNNMIILINVLNDMNYGIDKPCVRREKKYYFIRQSFKNEYIKFTIKIKNNNLNHKKQKINFLSKEKIKLIYNNNFNDKKYICYIKEKQKKFF